MHMRMGRRWPLETPEILQRQFVLSVPLSSQVLHAVDRWLGEFLIRNCLMIVAWVMQTQLFPTQCHDRSFLLLERHLFAAPASMLIYRDSAMTWSDVPDAIILFLASCAVSLLYTGTPTHFWCICPLLGFYCDQIGVPTRQIPDSFAALLFKLLQRSLVEFCVLLDALSLDPTYGSIFAPLGKLKIRKIIQYKNMKM